MKFQIITATRDHREPWLAMRDALYSGVDNAFHQEEQEMILAAADKDCLLAVSEDGVVCGMLEVTA